MPEQGGEDEKTSPEFGQLRVVVAPPDTDLVTPEFGPEHDSPKFGFTAPGSPSFGSQAEAKVHPETPDFGSLQGMDLKLGSPSSEGSSSPEGRSKRVSVDHLPAEPSGEEGLLSKMHEKLEKREIMLSWFYDELEAKSAELQAARLELQECEASRSELQQDLTAAMEKAKQDRIQAQEQNVQALEERLNEAKRLEEATRTLRLENDDLASELRSMRLWKQEAAALGDALERAEAEVFQRASEDRSSKELAEALVESEERLRRLEELESGGRMGRDVALAMEALAESQEEVEEMTASEWRAARAFEDLAEMSLELSEARAVAAADRQEHATALAALKAHSELRAAKLEDQVAELAQQLQVANGRAARDVTVQELETRVADLTASRTLLEHRAQSAERHLAVASEQDAEASTGRLRRLSLRLEEAEEEAESSGSGLARALAERQALELRLSAAEAAGKQMEASLERAETSAGQKISQLKAELQDASRRLDQELQGRSGLELRLKQRQELAESLQMELLEEKMLAAKGKAMISGLEVELETEKKGTELAQELRSRSASATTQLLQAQRADEALLLSELRSEQAAQHLELSELREALEMARQQRRAALQASERAQLARMKQQYQAVAMRRRSEVKEAARSASISEMIEESGAVLRQQHEGLRSEVHVCQAVLASRTAALNESEEERSKLQREVREAQKLAKSEQHCCRVLLTQLEEATLQSIEAAAEPSTLAVQPLKRQLQGAQRAAGSLGVSALPLSASVGSGSPMSSLRAHAGSQWPLPWGPPRELLSPRSNASELR